MLIVSIAFAITVLALRGVNSAYRCYKCNSGSDPYTCGINNFMDISIVKQDGCTCCREVQTGSIYFRTCETTDCSQLTGACYGDLCNGQERRLPYGSNYASSANCPRVLSSYQYGTSVVMTLLFQYLQYRLTK
jgi:hypothetical protein